jgi:hypothetical protein
MYCQAPGPLMRRRTAKQRDELTVLRRAWAPCRNPLSQLTVGENAPKAALGRPESF